MIPILYSTGCPNCRTLEMLLNNYGIKYEVHTDMQEMLNLGFTVAPMLSVEPGQYMRYREAVEWLGKQNSSD